MKLFVLTALLLPSICLAKLKSSDDILGQLMSLSMKSSGQGQAAYTYDSSKGSVHSILDLVEEMMRDQVSAADKVAADLKESLKVQTAAKYGMNSRISALNYALGAKYNAKKDLDAAEKAKNNAVEAVRTFEEASNKSEETAEKGKAALCKILKFLCEKPKKGTEEKCTKLLAMCNDGSAVNATTVNATTL